MPALIAFSCLRATTKRSTMASMCCTSDASRSVFSERSMSVPSTIIRRTPFLRTSVKTKSRSSPYTLKIGARSSISVPSGSDRIASRIWLDVRLGAGSALRGQCACPIVANSRLR